MPQAAGSFFEFGSRFGLTMALAPGSCGGTVWWSSTTTSIPCPRAKATSLSELVPQSTVTNSVAPNPRSVSMAFVLRP